VTTASPTSLDAHQVRNAQAAMVAAFAWSVGRGAQGMLPTAIQERVAFAIWSESRLFNYANDGTNTSHSPSVTPERAAILRRSLDLPHDAVGSNGRSTGVLQQTSEEVGGAWGSMAGTMIVAVAVNRFLGSADFRVTTNPIYEGRLVNQDGSTSRVYVRLSDAIAADVLRVQQPLADEARSSNYGPGQVSIARWIVATYGSNIIAAPAGSYLDRLLHHTTSN